MGIELGRNARGFDGAPMLQRSAFLEGSRCSPGIRFLSEAAEGLETSFGGLLNNIAGFGGDVSPDALLVAAWFKPLSLVSTFSFS